MCCVCVFVRFFFFFFFLLGGGREKKWIISFFFVHTQTPDVTKKRIQKYTTCERREEECQKTSLVSSSVVVKGEEYKSRVH